MSAIDSVLSVDRLGFARDSTKATLVGVATSHPPTGYSQQELLELFRITDRRIVSLYENSAIQNRYLTLPPRCADGGMPNESQGELLRKHQNWGRRLASDAVLGCLAESGHDVSDIRYLCCITTTGFLTPGMSALLIRDLEMSRSCARLDVVGMGCNAGLNGLNAVAAWCKSNPGSLAVLCCVEIASAAYVFDNTMRSAIVNCLFGDGAAAIACIGGSFRSRSCSVLGFASAIIPEHVDAMRFDWDESRHKFNFFLSRDIPYVIGAHCEAVLDSLLSNTDVRRRDISHWIVHSGGKKVIDSIKINLGLTNYDVRHTLGVLRDYGNLSSASFLFSFERLMKEGAVKSGDYGVMMTMGPGTTIEMVLVHWQ